MNHLERIKQAVEATRVRIDELVGPDCGCESGTEFEPEFICGWHKVVVDLEDTVSEVSAAEARARR